MMPVKKDHMQHLKLLQELAKHFANDENYEKECDDEDHDEEEEGYQHEREGRDVEADYDTGEEEESDADGESEQEEHETERLGHRMSPKRSKEMAIIVLAKKLGKMKKAM